MLDSARRSGGRIWDLSLLGGAAAAILLFSGQLESAERDFDAYIAERGEDLTACFKELPELRDQGLGLGMTRGAERGAPSVPIRRVVLALDASGSMAGRIGGQTKMDIARAAAIDFVSNLDEDIELGLVLFGHTGTNQESGRADSCRGVELTQSIQRDDRSALTRELENVSATGWTPLAAAIEQAGESFQATEVPGEQVVYVISDGEETCHGDPVEAARQLSESDVRAVVNIIGFDLPREERDALHAVAEAGNGRFLEVANARELQSSLSDAAQNRLANQGALARTQLNTGGGQAANALSTSGMLARSKLCLKAATGRERLGLAGWARERGLDSDTTRAVGELLDARAESYQSQLAEFEAEAERRRAAADAALQEDLDRTTDAFRDTQED
ncbi:vWA domain-containing protein [Billgrantia sp. C5P2]|uniref:vWA domain-containing protein n=1 Tax=Billgrantia sp. C5P2 TaxID=3436239 RepID=UPI003DA5AACD